MPRRNPISVKQSLTGELLCVSCNTVTEIMYVVHQLGRYMTKATKSHFEVAKHVLRYLKGKLNGPRLTWCAEDCSLSKHMPGELWAMADSSWADVKPARKSTLCYMLFMNNAVFSWRSSLVSILALLLLTCWIWDSSSLTMCHLLTNLPISVRLLVLLL